MSKIKVVIAVVSWATAIIIIYGLGGLFYGLWGFQSPSPLLRLVDLAFAGILAVVLQAGLILAPIVSDKSVGWRTVSILMMVPFAYFFLLHDLQSAFAGLNGISGISLNLLITLAIASVYGANIFLLIFKTESVTNQKQCP